MPQHPHARPEQSEGRDHQPDTVNDADGWHDVAPEDALSDAGHLCATAAGKRVVVARADGELYAVANDCPHAGQPIGEGETRGRIIICPFHGYAYDLKTGRNVDYPHDEPPIKRYPARIHAGRIQVRV